MDNTTKVIRFYKNGGPEVLKIEEIARPQPKGREVSIRVQAIALSRTDLLWREGSYLEQPVFPAQNVVFLQHLPAKSVETAGSFSSSPPVMVSVATSSTDSF